MTFGGEKQITSAIYKLTAAGQSHAYYTTNHGEQTLTDSLTVADTGIGIPQEHQSRVFERFYRVDKSHSKASGGTGLGLSIVKHAVQYHHGDIRLTSKPGEGTVIRITFPAAAR